MPVHVFGCLLAVVQIQHSASRLGRPVDFDAGVEKRNYSKPLIENSTFQLVEMSLAMNLGRRVPVQLFGCLLRAIQG